MKPTTFETHNDTKVDIDGTHLQGHIDTTFGALVCTFGEPTVGDEYKTDWEWEIEFSDGTVATVYNWKNGPNYSRQYHEKGLRADQITEWHVGGHKGEALALVKQALGGLA